VVLEILLNVGVVLLFLPAAYIYMGTRELSGAAMWYAIVISFHTRVPRPLSDVCPVHVAIVHAALRLLG
jgi:hypothetical protein